MVAWTSEDTGWRRLWGVLLLPLCLFLALSLFSYNWRDIGLLQAPAISPPDNLIGPVGAWLSFGLFMALGMGAYLAPLWCLGFGLICFFDREERVWPRGLWLFLVWLAVSGLIALRANGWEARCQLLNIPDAGGLFGRLLIQGVLERSLNKVGAAILLWSVLVVSLLLLVEVRNVIRAGRYLGGTAAALVQRLRAAVSERQDRHGELVREQRQLEKRRRRLERMVRQNRDEEPPPDVTGEAGPAEDEAEDEAETGEPPPARKKRKRCKAEAAAAPAAADDDEAPAAEYRLPPVSLLAEIPAAVGSYSVDTETTATVLVETLREFGIDSEVTNVEQGPVVTRYELLPAPGVRVERISGLSNNLALALKATSVRVQAPIPGKGVVGVEVPNSKSKMVGLREILEGKAWASRKADLPLVLGKDVGGADIVADLAEMPHLLIAGATGAGKTVCMNSVLAGLLMSMKPDELRLLLVDPKIVEFSVYNHLPHLVVPVVTDPHKVTLGLRWAINEMEKRYKMFAQVGVRNIKAFNNREVATQEELFGGDYDGGDRKGPPTTLPYIVIVIDELADLMLAAQADIENSIARLAQLSRAVGIHMIISTQRPSVNVITGTIKANFPARIAFQVAQKVDSRTILDTVGADKLLGRGDMLFLPPGTSKLMRAQGAMTTDLDIRNIVAFIKEQAGPEYDVEIKDKIETSGKAADMGEEDDDLLMQAVEIIRETRRASTSSLQRRLRIGYTRAARIMDILEERGIIGPPRGSEPREIIIDLDGDIPENPNDDEDTDDILDDDETPEED